MDMDKVLGYGEMARKISLFHNEMQPRNDSTLHRINRILHTEPFDSLFYGLYWSLVFIFGFPIIGVGYFIYTVLKGESKKETIHSFLSKKNTKDELKYELGVFITGCDSGFGKNLAQKLSRRSSNYTVFAGCLTDQGMEEFSKDHDASVGRIIPLKVDVTKDSDLKDVADLISKWLSNPQNEEKSTQRYLHAICCNAGIGTCAPIDWTDISIFQRIMDVNYYGMIRTVKAFLPLLKSQSCTLKYKNARIVNVTSIAGLVSNSYLSHYSASKFAAESFTQVLRLELNQFNIKVSCINPSYHATPMAKNQLERHVTKYWHELTAERKEEYGVDFFESLEIHTRERKSLAWDPNIVVDEIIEKSIDSLVPELQVLVGMNAKFVTILVRMLPSWIQNTLIGNSGKPVKKPYKMLTDNT